jgi:hypothetical protein
MRCVDDVRVDVERRRECAHAPSCSCAIFTGTPQIVEQRRVDVAELMPRPPAAPDAFGRWLIAKENPRL